ncbi:hypothetical protein [Nostoc sp.]|uniref:hypothetical protein n=1 Tax=Nostoc sp. TaxID=1180 RepID=UPI003FA5EBBE
MCVSEAPPKEIATFGLLANSTAVIIGAMIIAPLMLPIRGLAFGALIGTHIPHFNLKYGRITK